ncbi:MAG: hypothetical protein GXP42_04720 [Chloroflexi bacterium]|nr:hypothetical protein [Chloroflexota bacterium]
MKLLHAYPLKGMFQPGERVRFRLALEAKTATRARVQALITHLDRPVGRVSRSVDLQPGHQNIDLTWRSPAAAPRGYGVAFSLWKEEQRLGRPLFTAFDVLPAWTTFPRYGFLTDFAPGRTDMAATCERLSRFHINGLQFYDWQFRHDALLPPDEEYVDPLGRTLSLRTVREFITAAHEHGMAAMPYLAIYAASLEFWRDHPQWRLVDERGEALTFMDFLGLMDPTAGRGWSEHLLNECTRALAALPFDGLHVDQYGEPRKAFDVQGDAVNLPQAFVDFIGSLKKRHPTKTVVFNAVSAWPIEALANSRQDFEYIEIWPPDADYADVLRIVQDARRLSGGRPVVIALYLPATRPAHVRLADALIFSAGGSRIELGEQARLLADPYFPKHQALSSELESILRRYYDFAVRYGELLGPYVHDRPTLRVKAPPGVCSIARRSGRYLTVALINFTGVEPRRWDEAHPEPVSHENPAVFIEIEAPVVRAWWASPDRHDPAMHSIPHHRQGEWLRVAPPHLDYWTILVIELGA